MVDQVAMNNWPADLAFPPVPVMSGLVTGRASCAGAGVARAIPGPGVAGVRRRRHRDARAARIGGEGRGSGVWTISRPGAQKERRAGMWRRAPTVPLMGT